MASNIIQGGDEVNAVVLDLGSYQCRAGYAGDDAPKAVFSSSVGTLSEANGAASGGSGGEGSGRGLVMGDEALAFRRPNMQIANPYGEDDLIGDWDLASKVWTYALKDRLQVNPSEAAVMFAEPTHTPRAAREKAVAALFEGLRCPALFLAKAAVLSAFALGRQTALVVDAGHGGTTVAAVYEGYVLDKSVSRTPLGGAALTRASAAMLSSAAAAKGAKLLARHMFRRVPVEGYNKFEVKMEPTEGVTESYNAWGLDQVAGDAKECIVRAAPAALAQCEADSLTAATYELPDGTELSIKEDRYRAAEMLFDTSVVSSFKGLSSDPRLSGRDLISWPALVKGAIDGCDGDVRREFWNAVLLTGGSSLLSDGRERLEAELSALAPGGTKVKVNAPVNPTEKRFATWIGGSILASLGSFHQMWMSKAEYEEHGAALIHRKSP